MISGAASLQSWLTSPDGLGAEINMLRRWSARRSFGDAIFLKDGVDRTPDWRRLLLAASVLAESSQPADHETALMIAHAAIAFCSESRLQDAGAIVLSQLSNSQGQRLAEQRGCLAPALTARLGLMERLLFTRRELESAIAINPHTEILGNSFQVNFWNDLDAAHWTSATAPTTAGKTYLVLNWLLGELARNQAGLAVFLAPTRALVGEIEGGLLDLKAAFAIPRLRIASLPLRVYGDGSNPTILVFTQERLHLFLNGFDQPPAIDICIVDEAQKLADGGRGVILQDAVERILRTNAKSRFVFLSPHASNPELLLREAPPAAATASIVGRTPMVTQNLLIAKAKHRKPQEWELFLVSQDSEQHVGEFHLHDRLVGEQSTKRLSFIALALGRKEPGTLIYANGPSQAEKIAAQIYDGLQAIEGAQDGPIDEELQDLIEFCRSSIHTRFQLVRLLERGVGFHYGNMPAILRRELERLFKIGKIRFLVCTSTLVEGVNLACRTIIVRGPKKGFGKDTHMTPQDFWNLAGRAGRWGADFHGNIVCIDAHKEDLWPSGVPQKGAYPIMRAADQVIQSADEIADYIERRSKANLPADDDTKEHVAAYLLGHQARRGGLLELASIRALPHAAQRRLEGVVSTALGAVELPEAVLTAHPGISAIAH